MATPSPSCFKWRLFATFCQTSGIVPEVASPHQVAEFLVYMFDVRKCFYRTIASYRSALVNVLRFTSVPRRIPTWDLGLVLKFLAEEENCNDKFSPHLLTAKNLLSLATAGPCHSLAALESKVVVVSHDPPNR